MQVFVTTNVDSKRLLVLIQQKVKLISQRYVINITKILDKEKLNKLASQNIGVPFIKCENKTIHGIQNVLRFINNFKPVSNKQREPVNIVPQDDTDMHAYLMGLAKQNDNDDVPVGDSMNVNEAMKKHRDYRNKRAVDNMKKTPVYEDEDDGQYETDEGKQNMDLISQKLGIGGGNGGGADNINFMKFDGMDDDEELMSNYLQNNGGNDYY